MEVYSDYYIDYLNRRVHVLEKGKPLYSNNLPNQMGTDFQKRFIEKERILKDVLDFEWLCYSSDGLVLLYKKHNLSLASGKVERLHKPFLDVIKK